LVAVKFARMLPHDRNIHRRSPASPKHAFTLTELLVVVAILLVIAMVAFPSVSRMITAGQRAECASNLRQVGVALQSYLGEHNMIFPTCWVSLPCNPRVNGTTGDFRSLGGHLASYLKNESHSAELVYLPVLHCPAWPEKINPQEAVALPPVWYNTYRLVLGAPGKVNPFGGASGRPKLSALNIGRDFGRTPAKFPVVFNLDQDLPYPGEVPQIPERPVFLTGRNVLFLDGHVGFETDLEFLGDRFR